MKVTRARITAPQTVELLEVELDPQPDQLVIRNLACGICHSEKAGWLKGPPPGATTGIGHEPVGEIVEVGREVKGEWRIGQRVTGFWGNGFGTYSVADPTRVRPVPEGLPTLHALGEVLACLITCARGWKHEIGDDLALVGCGFMGVLSLKPVAASARTVIAIDLRQDRLEFAGRNGATHLVRADENPFEQVREITGGRLCRLVTEASGVVAGLDLALTLLARHRPVLNLISYYNYEATVKNLAALAHVGASVRNPHPSWADDLLVELELGLEYAARGTWDLADAITHVWPLEQIGEKFGVAMRGEDGYLKGVITMA